MTAPLRTVAASPLPSPSPSPSHPLLATAKTLNALLHMPDAPPMEMSQIGLIYRAEGNANLVLALPQFKKVLRLPKMISSSRQTQQAQTQHSCQLPAGAGQPEGQPSVSDPTKASSAKAGVLTMPDFMAYIEIMRRLLGNEFVCTADIVAIPKESDIFWINEHIRAHRPVSRLDKEFVGPFGLMLPDVTQLPATFDVLLANLQAKDMNADMDICSASSRSNKDSSGITRLGDTYAIEIKPKQGWLQLPSDVSDLFDLMPAGDGKTDSTPDPAKVRPTGPLLLTPNRCRCRYCSMQFVKLQTGKIKRLGDYCPLELFSGTPGRMLDALNALFACPQNNLRVFQSGNLIYGDHANSISCEELHSRVFPSEIMALIKHLLVACLLREYNNELAKELETRSQIQSPSQSQSQSQSVNSSLNLSHVAGAAFWESPSVPFGGMETKAATEIYAANVDVAAAAAAVVTVSSHVKELKQVKKQQDTRERKEQKEADDGIVEFVEAVVGQPQRRFTRAAAEKAIPRYTKRGKIATTTRTTTCQRESTTTAPTNLSTNVAIGATRTEAKTETETETLATVTSTTTMTTTTTTTTTPNPKATQVEINKAEIFHLPKNCVLQKILHLQLLVKVSEQTLKEDKRKLSVVFCLFFILSQ
ncbi:GH22003 [Drosophila grimshawi]|uniref:Inositol-pentakisphosphate 2-kinase n=1 Tax=Drosophila grimshawi TaxID=7222 RepID=B4J983_DROGR|nr:GH22003 [Drosophila grimshawi]